MVLDKCSDNADVSKHCAYSIKHNTGVRHETVLHNISKRQRLCKWPAALAYRNACNTAVEQ